MKAFTTLNDSLDICGNPWSKIVVQSCERKKLIEMCVGKAW